MVTGAGRGIGAAIAAKLATMGATVVLCGRTRKPLESTADAISKAGGRAEVLQCDVTDLRSVEAVAARVDQILGRLDILVNNAGVAGFGGPLHQLPPESWDAGAEYEFARSVLLHSRLRPHDDSRPPAGTSSTFLRWPERMPCPTAPLTPLQSGV